MHSAHKGNLVSDKNGTGIENDAAKAAGSDDAQKPEAKDKDDEVDSDLAATAPPAGAVIARSRSVLV